MTPIFLIPLSIFAISISVLLLVIVRGDTLSDMVLAADAVLYTSSVFLAILGLLLESRALATCVIVIVLWAFAFDIYFAKYLERGELGD